MADVGGIAADALYHHGIPWLASSYDNTPSTPKSPYSPLQNPCHIFVIFCTCHYLCLFSVIFLPPQNPPKQQNPRQKHSEK